MATAKIYEVDDVSYVILESYPPKLSITAKGKTRTSGWSGGQLIPRFSGHVPAINGTYEFDFVAQFPKGISLPALTSIEANYILAPIPNNLMKIVIHSETKDVNVAFDKPAVGVQPPTKRTATGYSDSLDVNDAFANAIHNLPAPVPEYPDQMTSIKVTEIGAVIGGIGNITKTYVTIESN